MRHAPIAQMHRGRPRNTHKRQGLSSDKLHLVVVVLSFAGHLNVSVLLDLWDLWAKLVVTVGATAFWANVFHGWLLVGLWGRDWRTVQPSLREG